MIDFLFGTAPGVVTDPSQQRAMSQEDLAKMQYAQFVALSNLSSQMKHAAALAVDNYLRDHGDIRSLDERFADFKVRLSDAVKRSGMGTK
jgi:hypothetical protein